MIRTKDIFSSEQEYHQNPGKSCYIDRIIENVTECRVAVGSFLGLSGANAINSNTKPSGCFYEGIHGFFNRRIDPSSTIPDKRGAGICKGKGITHFIPQSIHSQHVELFL